MSFWQIHPLNARHGLTAILSDLRAATREAVAMASAHTPLPAFDLVIHGQQAGGIAELAITARTPAPGLIEITLDPAHWDAAAFTRSLTRQFHHLLRQDATGRPRGLGEALVAEGLAGHFVTEVLGGPPDPWDAVTPSAAALRRAISDWARPGYDHEAWFMGRGDLRRWTGFGLGHRLVSAYLDRHPDASAVTLIPIRADEFRPILRSLIQSSGEDTGDDAAEDAADQPPAETPPPPTP